MPAVWTLDYKIQQLTRLIQGALTNRPQVIKLFCVVKIGTEHFYD